MWTSYRRILSEVNWLQGLSRDPRAILGRMIVVGLTGGIASGKSTVAQMFKRFGAVIIDADELARDVVQPGKPAWREIVKIFGDGVLNRNGSINRHALGGIVFHNRRKLRRLERIIHPRVAREQQRLASRIARRSPDAVIVYEVPLLFESGAHKRVDKTIVVTADRHTQVARLKQRNGMTKTEALRRIKAQMPLAEKVRRADVVVDGTVDKALMRKDVRRLIQSFRRLQPHL
jgi:dephospho-CoA kinase